MSESSHEATFVSPDDVEAYKQRVTDLDRQLNAALDSGDASNASRIAGLAAEARADLKNIQSKFESQRAMYDQENAWIKKQNAKVYDIQRSIAEQRALLDDTQRSLQLYFNDQYPKQSQAPSINQSPHREPRSKDSGVINSLLSAFHPSPPPTNNLMQQRYAAMANQSNQATNQSARSPSPSEPTIVTLLAKARHNIRLCQVNLEQQNLKVDSIDMTSHPSALNDAQAAAIAANPSQSLLSIKAVRKDTVDRIQKELAYADEFARHIDEFEKFLSFVQRPIATQPHQSVNQSRHSPPQRQHQR